jgi:hypothetical protein
MSPQPSQHRLSTRQDQVSLSADPAAWADSWKDCVQEQDRDQQIRGHAEIITEGRETKDGLAVAHIGRGLAYEKKGDQDRAIADLDKAIETRRESGSNPTTHLAPYGYRGPLSGSGAGRLVRCTGSSNWTAGAATSGRILEVLAMVTAVVIAIAYIASIMVGWL